MPPPAHEGDDEVKKGPSRHKRDEAYEEYDDEDRQDNSVSTAHRNSILGCVSLDCLPFWSREQDLEWKKGGGGGGR